MAKTGKFNLNYRFDAQLREVPEDRKSMRSYVDFLQIEVRRVKVPPPSPVRDVEAPSDPARAAVKFLGEIGSYAKILGDLKEAREALEKSLELIESHQLGRIAWAVHTLRYGDVLKFQQEDLAAETAFRSVLEMSLRHSELRELEDFAYQHLGKLAIERKDRKGAEEFLMKALALRKQKKLPELIASTELALRKVRSL